ncbi:helix-turn-helix transcriptional regulator [Streptomyces longispororuber]
MVTQPPQRLSTDTLVALCDILECTPEQPDRARGREHAGSARPLTASPVT